MSALRRLVLYRLHCNHMLCNVVQVEIERFKRFSAAPRRRPRADDVEGDAVPKFLNGRSLRSYQLVSLAWMVNNWRSRRNCILGDEMCASAPSSDPVLQGAAYRPDCHSLLTQQRLVRRQLRWWP